MEAGKKVRIARIVGFICLGLALLNVVAVALAMIAHEKASGANVAVASMLVVGGANCLRRSNRRPPPDA